MRVTLTIDTGNAAFADEGEGAEVARILRGAALKFEQVGTPIAFTLRDLNGNTVGRVEVES